MGIKRHIQGALSKVTAGIAFAFPPPAIPGVGTSGGFTFVLEDRSGGSIEFLGKNSQIFMAEARKRPELAGVMTTALFGVPQVGITVDQEKVLSQQVSLTSVYQTLQTFMGGSLVNYFNRFGRQWQVYVQSEGNYRTNADNLGKFYVNNAAGQMVPLSTLTGNDPRSGPEFVMKYNQFQCVQINGSAAAGYSSGQAIAALEDVFKKTMPAEMGYDYMGMSYQEVKAAQGVSPGVVFGISFFIVFLIMAAQYESWTLPLSVLLGVPIAVFGAFTALYFMRLDNNVYAQIGLVMLIGLSSKNAILIVEFAKAEYDAGKPLLEASLTGARLRLRPILMTAFAFILGCVPLARASGAGAISRQVLGWTVIGGMLCASLLAIFFIPVSFDVVERFGALFGGKEGHGQPPPPENPDAPHKVEGPTRMNTRMTSFRQNHSSPTTLALLTAGCKVGPNYSRPAVSTPDQYRGGAPAIGNQPPTGNFADMTWQTVFQDETLQALIKEALTNNYDIRIAATRVLQANAQLGVTRANQLPTLNGAFGINYQRNQFALNGPTVDTATLQLNYIVDFWGQYRRATEAARANLLASKFGQDVVQTTLIASIATTYYSLSQFDEQLAIAEKTVAADHDIVRINTIKFKGGESAITDVYQADLLLQQAEAQTIASKQAVEQTENQLSILLGRNPGPVARGLDLTAQPHLAEIPTGIALRAPPAQARRSPDRRKPGSRERQCRRRQSRLLSPDSAHRPLRCIEHRTHQLSAGTRHHLVARRPGFTADLQRRSHPQRLSPRLGTA